MMRQREADELNKRYSVVDNTLGACTLTLLAQQDSTEGSPHAGPLTVGGT